MKRKPLDKVQTESEREKYWHDWSENNNNTWLKIRDLAKQHLEGVLFQAQRNSLWEAYCDMERELFERNGNDPLIAALREHERRCKEQIEKVPPQRRSRLDDAVTERTHDAERLALITGFLIGVEALKRDGLSIAVDSAGVVSRYRMTAKPPRSSFQKEAR